MPLPPTPTPAQDFPPLTDAENARLATLLSSVSSRTLLQSLAHLCEGNQDAGLILATLLARLPAETDTAAAPPLATL